MKSAIYAFSGDPITFGHIDIIKRAARVFDRVVVAIGVNANKQYLFSLEERTQMARRSLLFLPNVEVKSFTGMLVDFAYENDIDVIVKGVRSSKDFEYEMELHSLGESQNLEIDTFVLFAKPSLAHVSSSAVKDIQREQGLLQDYVPAYVKQCLESKMSGQYIVGLTGEIGAGKSYLGRQLVQEAEAMGLEAHNIELDQLAWQIQSDLSEAKYAQVRSQIVAEFGNAVQLPDGSINRQALGEIVFADIVKLRRLNDIMANPILVRLRKELRGKKGLIFLNAALLVEAKMSKLVNYNMILVKASQAVQKQRLLERGLSEEQITRRLQSQYTYEQKKEILEKEITRERQGQLWEVESERGEVREVVKIVASYFSLIKK